VVVAEDVADAGSGLMARAHVFGWVEPVRSGDPPPSVELGIVELVVCTA
jgi:hypothetical protein